MNGVPQSHSSRLPLGATDSHVHIECYAGEGDSADDTQGLEAYRRTFRDTGLERAVFVQSGRYGFDNTCLLSAIAAFGPNARGVASVTADCADEQLAALHAGGIRGIRLSHLSTVTLPLEHLDVIAERIAPYGWHAGLLVEPGDLAPLSPRLSKLSISFALDHMARLRVGMPGFDRYLAELCALARLPHCWIKVSAAEFLSDAYPDYGDLDVAVEALSKVTDRIVWGTDWPHPSTEKSGKPKPTPDDLLAALHRWFPGPDALEQVLVANPAQLYGFAEQL